MRETECTWHLLQAPSRLLCARCWRQEQQTCGKALQEPRINVCEQAEEEDEQVELVDVGQENQGNNSDKAPVRKQAVLLGSLCPHCHARNEVVRHTIRDLQDKDEPEDQLCRPLLQSSIVHVPELHDCSLHAHNVDIVVKHLQGQLSDEQQHQDPLVTGVQEINLLVHAGRQCVRLAYLASIAVVSIKESCHPAALQLVCLVVGRDGLGNGAIRVLQENRSMHGLHLQRIFDLLARVDRRQEVLTFRGRHVSCSICRPASYRSGKKWSGKNTVRCSWRFL